MSSLITIREMTPADCEPISLAFHAQGWDKPVSQYESYWQEQLVGTRLVLVAEVAERFAGYVTVVWASTYPPFLDAGIPEIVDFNVLLKFRRRRIGTLLMDAAEARIAQQADSAGIGVGLTADYGPAHVLYCRRGYIPDGLGIFQAGRHCKYGDRPVVNDDLALFFIKQLG